jgi:cyanophycin synthetase
MAISALAKADTFARVGAHRLQREATRARALAGGGGRIPSSTDLNAATIRAAAARLGVGVEPLPGDFLKLTYAGASSYCRGSDFAFESLVPWHLCGDKPATSMILSEHGIPVPAFRSFGISGFRPALEYLRATGGPVVAKPARRTSSGQGVTMGITTPRALRSAFAKACAVSGDVMLEAQVAGENVRVTILDGQVLGAVHRIPARVVGDGRQTIAQLIAAKNEAWRSQSPENRLQRPIEVDGELKRILRSSGLGLRSTPAQGKVVYVREVCNADQGGEIEDVLGGLHEDHVRLALTAADVMGPVLCAVDLIVRDLRAPATPGGVFVNEINTTPGLYATRAPVDGAPSTAATERVLRHLFSIDDGH